MLVAPPVETGFTCWRPGQGGVSPQRGQDVQPFKYEIPGVPGWQPAGGGAPWRLHLLQKNQAIRSMPVVAPPGCSIAERPRLARPRSVGSWRFVSARPSNCWPRDPGMDGLAFFAELTGPGASIPAMTVSSQSPVGWSLGQRKSVTSIDQGVRVPIRKNQPRL